MKPIGLSALIALVLIACPQFGHASAQNGKAVSIVESGEGAERRFSVIADNADITDLLKQLFAKTGDEYLIDQGVAGAVNLKVTAVPMSVVFQRIAELAHPPLKIRLDGKAYHVSVDAAKQQQMAVIALPQNLVGMDLIGGMRNRGIPQNPYQSAAPANRLVTLDVPKQNPIPLSQALARISAQTLYPVRLDPRIPSRLSFSGTITGASLSMVLNAIAETSGLKIVDYGSYAMLVPTDQFQITLNNILIGQNASAALCPNCGTHLAPGWRFCPNCGQPILRGAQQAPGRPNMNPRTNHR